MKGLRGWCAACDRNVGLTAPTGNALDVLWTRRHTCNGKPSAVGQEGTLEAPVGIDPFIGTRGGWVHTEASCYEGRSGQ